MGKPLVSAIMPTGNRPNYVKHAIEMFLGQTWDNKELIILDDSTPDKQLPQIFDSRIRHIRLYDRLSLGSKHDMAIGLSFGEFICHWDDDDWYSANRIEKQVSILNSERAEVCGFRRDLVFFSTGKWGRITGPGGLEITGWAGNAGMAYSKYGFHDGTAMFRRNVMREILRYGLHPVSQKVFFLNEIVNRGMKHVDITNGNDFVYIRHEDNIWQPDWSKCFSETEAPVWFPEHEIEFYTKTKAF